MPASPISSQTAFEPTQMWWATLSASPPATREPAGANILFESFAPGTGDPLIRQNHDDRDAVAPGGPAADRAVAQENIGQVCVDLELDRAAIALAPGHRHSFSVRSMDGLPGIGQALGEVAELLADFNEIAKRDQPDFRICGHGTLVGEFRGDSCNCHALSTQSSEQQSQGRGASSSTLGIWLANHDVHVNQVAWQVGEASLVQLRGRWSLPAEQADGPPIEADESDRLGIVSAQSRQRIVWFTPPARDVRSPDPG
jgi:hypothetical protein